MAGKPKVAVCLSYFNSVKEIPRLLDPLVDNIEMVIAVDGKYPLFNWPSNVSTDGSTELLQEKYDAAVYTFFDPVEQIDKRNKYLDIAEFNGIDYVIVLDADDYLHPAPINQRWNMFYEQLGKLTGMDLLANLWFYISPLWVKNWNMVKDSSWQRYTRVIRPDRIRYDTTHYTYVDRDDTDIFILPNKTVDGIRFTSDSVLRNLKYVKAGYNWAERQMDEENDRMKKAGRKRFNFWLRQLHQALNMPNTKVTMDNTPEQITKNIDSMIQRKTYSQTSHSSTSQKQRQP